MAVRTESPDNTYTQKVKELVELIYPTEWSDRPSVFGDARDYFHNESRKHEKLERKKQEFAHLHATQSINQDKVGREIALLELELEEKRYERVNRIRKAAMLILSLCEGESYEETQIASAKLLGTLMLTTRGNVRHFERLHQRLKPIYKSILTLRLVDKIIQHNQLSHVYLSKFGASLLRFTGDEDMVRSWQQELAMPIIIASLCQDIGLHDPKALGILLGEDGSKDEFRVLEDNERKLLLKTNYLRTMDYLENGLGIAKFIGNTKAERAAFVETQQAAHDFCCKLMKDAYASKVGIGELLKIPQIYASIILSTKPNYDRKELPKAYILIEQLAKKGNINPKLAEAFIGIVGYFPQGYGITYVPQNEKGIDREQLEYAIVTRLNPENPSEPFCRLVTRGGTYVTSTMETIITRDANLYFKSNHKKLIRIGKQRLIEIMTGLSNDFNPAQVDDFIPSFWEPSDYFSVKKHQNLWNRSP